MSSLVRRSILLVPFVVVHLVLDDSAGLRAEDSPERVAQLRSTLERQRLRRARSRATYQRDMRDIAVQEAWDQGLLNQQMVLQQAGIGGFAPRNGALNPLAGAGMAGDWPGFFPGGLVLVSNTTPARPAGAAPASQRSPQFSTILIPQPPIYQSPIQIPQPPIYRPPISIPQGPGLPPLQIPQAPVYQPPISIPQPPISQPPIQVPMFQGYQHFGGMGGGFHGGWSGGSAGGWHGGGFGGGGHR
jgi:hypothetical protein